MTRPAGRGRPRRTEAEVLDEIHALEQAIGVRGEQQRRDVQRLSRLRRQLGMSAPNVDRSRKIDPDEVQRAITTAMGNISEAARILSERLGEHVSRSTFRRHLERFPRR